jgi:hypothetical protein
MSRGRAPGRGSPGKAPQENRGPGEPRGDAITRRIAVRQKGRLILPGTDIARRCRWEISLCCRSDQDRPAARSARSTVPAAPAAVRPISADTAPRSIARAATATAPRPAARSPTTTATALALEVPFVCSAKDAPNNLHLVKINSV